MDQSIVRPCFPTRDSETLRSRQTDVLDLISSLTHQITHRRRCFRENTGPREAGFVSERSIYPWVRKAAELLPGSCVIWQRESSFSRDN